MRYFLFVILTVLTSNCVKDSQIMYQRNPEWELADKIYDGEIGKKVFCQLKKEKKLHVCESGWDLRSKEKIQVMHCGFFYFDEIDIAQARELLLAAGNLYLATINENERMRPFLENYPFTLENIEICIFLQNRDGSKLSPEKLCILSFTKGILRYEIGALDSKGYLTEICEEKYDEAMQKITTSSTRQSKDIL